MPGGTKTIHVALAFDERIWAPAYATMRGVCLATHRRKDLTFHLCHPRLGDTEMADLEKITSEFGSRLVHYNVDEDENFTHFARTLPHTRHISALMYARIVFGRILPAHVHRVIYLDCDILVRAPIEALYGADLAGRPLGAVKDPQAYRFGNGRDVAQDRDLFDPADPYFNSGMLLIDLDAWRSEDVVARLYALQAEGLLQRLPNDQQILNYLFRNNWTQLDGLWNAFASGRGIEILDPKAVHYTGLNKPWNLINGLPFSRVYRHVMTNELFYRYLRYRWAQYWLTLGRRLIGRK